MKILKNSIYIVLLLSASLACFTSCNKWLEVSSDSETTQEKLFENYDGFYTAVNGVYRLLGDKSLYGQNLSWGMASVLGNNYDDTKLPVDYVTVANGNYTSAYSTALISPIWEKGYRAIANCNNVLGNIAGKENSFFPMGAVEKDVITGEMLGVRAMIHLDLLRLFAPATLANDGGAYIPYVTVFPDKQPRHMAVAEVLENIIKDLEQAKALLAYNDTAYNSGAINTVVQRMGSYSASGGTAKGGLFYSFRGVRMNYFAATALLARAYQWRNAPGDMEKAYRAAGDMYRYSTVYTWFQFTPASSSSRSAMESVENEICRKMYDDILFAGYNSLMYTIFNNNNYNQAVPGKFLYKNVAHLFAADPDDYRTTRLINTDFTSRRWSSPDVTTNSTITNDVITYQGPLAPVIRMSEVYYIMCEYLAGSNLGEAITLLDKLRLARGEKTPLSSTLTKEEFLDKLYLDMTREFMSEGQTFYLYKRLNRPIYNGAVSLDMTGRYVLPIPYSETDYTGL